MGGRSARFETESDIGGHSRTQMITNPVITLITPEIKHAPRPESNDQAES